MESNPRPEAFVSSRITTISELPHLKEHGNALSSKTTFLSLVEERDRSDFFGASTTQLEGTETVLVL
jgi:hypothetical protein